ncbi:outer membrane beta-barrel protein [Shewanella sp. D64]|uniref:OmpA family protein n=1 Tax=unclassified Shewanella TaxID=196818 RepID=UPI0022BA3D6A|nr:MULTISPECIES: OmpA family protein [unclassified Shewanella]MEC4725865.1 outer membrane beta-barrel protein [Shewanella sp. D64]MEC4737120.1 outer membrane beta-barrel protein [Shewanella sp. E94]WBJ95687.1 outer membrane beta-barrel protein [Shewanella sp. MTB7]
MKKSLIFALCCGAPLSHAVAETSENFWYTGVDIGQGYYANGGNEASYDSTRNRLSGGLHLGYQFNGYFSTELAYQYLGKAYANYNNGQISAEFQQGVMSARLGYPVTDNLYPYLKVGGAGWMGDVKGLNNVDTDGFSPVFGAGLSYALTDNLALRAEYQFTQSLGDSAAGFSDHHLATIGVSWRFGFSPKPEPIIQEKLVEVIIEKPVEVKTYIVSGVDSDTIFAHNSSQLVSTKPLEKTLAFLAQYPTSVITITGHSDSTGPEKYNQWMSERRAHSVANYFITEGVNKARINVLGKGESEPVADNSTEMGRAMNRRVEMVVQPFEIKSPTII